MEGLGLLMTKRKLSTKRKKKMAADWLFWATELLPFNNVDKSHSML